MDSYSIETASFMGPVKCPVYKMPFKVLLVFFTPRIMARFTGQDPNTPGSVCTCMIISLCYQVVDTVSYGIYKAQTESSPSNSSLYETLT